MHQHKGKKILLYFFLLILVGSINNVGFNNLKFQKINFIQVAGLSDEENQSLLKKIENLNLNNIFSINVEKIKHEIELSSLIEKYHISKKYPSSISINIQKTEFLAKINIDGKIFLVGSNGKFTEAEFSKIQLPFIFGNPTIDDFRILKTIIDQSKISYNEIKNFYFFPSKRWDLELKDNTIIKLSDNNIQKSLSLAIKFLHNDKLKDVNVIDARIKNQVILND